MLFQAIPTSCGVFASTCATWGQHPNTKYLHHDEVKPEKKHGKIKIISGSNIQYIYNVPEVEDIVTKPSIKYKDDIAVTVKGPTSFFDVALLEFDLFSGAYKGHYGGRAVLVYALSCFGFF